MIFSKTSALPLKFEKAMPFLRHFLLREVPYGNKKEEMQCESGNGYPMLIGSANTM